MEPTCGVSTSRNFTVEGYGRDCCCIEFMDSNREGWHSGSLFVEDGPAPETPSNLCGRCNRRILFGYVIAHDKDCQYGCETQLGLPPGKIMCLDCFSAHPRIHMKLEVERGLLAYAGRNTRMYLYFHYLPPGINTKGAHNKH